MKISLPKHMPLRYLFPFLGAVLLLQLVEGTSFFASLTFCAFLLVMTDAFNTVGGLVYPSGSYIFFLGTLSVGVGGLLKTLLGEPLESHLFNAQKSLLVYLAGAVCIWVAAKIGARIRRRTPLLIRLQIADDRITQTAVGSAIFGQFGSLVMPASIQSSFNQLNTFLWVALLLAVYGTARRTGGRKSFSPLAFTIWLWMTVGWGILQFSKAGMYIPSVIWLIAVSLVGYRTTVKKALIVGVLAMAASSVLTPVSQVGRIYRMDPDAHEKAFELLMHPLDTRARYLDIARRGQSSGKDYHWYDQPQGLLDRLTMFPIDDALIHRTDQGFRRGIFPIVTYAVNMIPRYLVKDKPVYHWGNRYAHEIGLLGKHDETTGISFTPFSEGYHCVGWWGVTAVFLPVYLMMFSICDSLTGSTDQTLWASIYIILFSHTAPEGVLNTPFLAVSTVAVGIVLAAMIQRYIMPLLGGLFVPTTRRVQEAPVAGEWSNPIRGVALGAPRTIEGKL